MRTVRSLLNEKGYSIWHTSPDTKVYDALEQLAKYDIGALVVLENDQMVGIFSERDYARKVILRGKSSKELAVREIMNHHVITIGIDRAIGDALSLMSENHIRHLPVMEADKLVGVISICDMSKAMINEQDELINKLEGYIMKNSSLVP